MAKNSAFKKFRGINDAELSLVLENHAMILKGVSGALTMVLRERRLLLLWSVVVTVALVMLLVLR
jgi:hypothetical protein